MCPDGTCSEIEPIGNEEKSIGKFNALSIASGKRNMRGEAYLMCLHCGLAGWHGEHEWNEPVCPFCRIRSSNA